MPRNLKDDVSWSIIENSPILGPGSTLLATSMVLDGKPIIVSSARTLLCSSHMSRHLQVLYYDGCCWVLRSEFPKQTSRNVGC